MRKLQVIGIVIVFCLACVNDKTEPIENIQKVAAYDYGKMPKKEPINEEASSILNDWAAFSDFSKSAEILYQATSSEDLALAIDDILEKEKLLGESKYPEQFDVPQVKSRQRVLLTFILKARGDIIGKRNPTNSMIQLFNAYNAFRNQFNIITDNRLELNLFLNEE